MLKKIGWHDKISQGLVRRRMVNTVPLMMVMTEDEASVSFADINGNPDVASTFYSNGKNFHAWCNDLWANIWNSSSKFDEDEIIECDYLPIQSQK